METLIRVSDETSQNLKLKCSSFTNLDLDIILNHIIPRLDGKTLIALLCTSSKLHRLYSDENLWRKICTDMWPSLLDPIASDVVSSFPRGFRSFFSDAFRSIQHVGDFLYPPPPPLPEIIFAVDVYCKPGPAFISKVERINARDENFVMHYYEVNTPITIPNGRNYKEWFEEKLRPSWIFIDPFRKRAVNMLNCKPGRNTWTSRMVGWGIFELKYRVVVKRKVTCHVNFRWHWSDKRNELFVKSVELKMMYRNALLPMVRMKASFNGFSEMRDRNACKIGSTIERFNLFLG